MGHILHLSLLQAGTGRADAEEKDLMSFRNKAGKSRTFVLEGTARNIKETVAGMAVKMMVMFFARSFIENA